MHELKLVDKLWHAACQLLCSVQSMATPPGVWMVPVAELVASCKVTASLAAEVALAIGTLLLL